MSTEISARSVLNLETNGFADAKQRYLDLSLPIPDIYELAEDYGLDSDKLYKTFVNEGWLRLRREMEQSGVTAIQAAENNLVDKWKESVDAVMKEMVQRNLQLIDSRKILLTEYLDKMMLKGTLSARDAIAYLKVLTDIEKEFQKLVVDEKHRMDAGGKGPMENFQLSIAAKAEALRKIAQTKQQRAGEETTVVTPQKTVERRERLRDIK